jgi:methyl-accepting chemotaxis protein
VEIVMLDVLFASFSLLNVSGIVIMLAIFALLVGGVGVTFLVRARYASIERDLQRNGDAAGNFESPVLNEIAREALSALRLAADASGVNTQAIVEHRFQSELRALFMGERFVKAATGLLIIFGLVGTFYGLTMSIGKLVTLVSGDVGQTADLAQSLTRGLTETLAGMSVAFSSSLFGILSAIVMTLLGVFFSISERRTSVMVQVEAHLDNVLLVRAGDVAPAAGTSGPRSDARLERVMLSFGESVDRLDAIVGQFEAALTNFSSTTRDFREFNHHLKDNIQRMSLSFADLSEALKQQASRPRDGR